MNLKHIIESWRDEEYRESLVGETRAQLPENPAGEIELDEADLSIVAGADSSISFSDSATDTETITSSITVTVTVTFSASVTITTVVKQPE